ncbi:MAG: hypothetical protein ACPGXL_09590 [Chitinophagales bacterium]
MRNLLPHHLHLQYSTQDLAENFDAFILLIQIKGETGTTLLEKDKYRYQHRNETKLFNWEVTQKIINPLVERVYAFNGFISHFSGTTFSIVFRVGMPTILEFIRSWNHIVEQQSNLFYNYQLQNKIGIARGIVKHNKVVSQQICQQKPSINGTMDCFWGSVFTWAKQALSNSRKDCVVAHESAVPVEYTNIPEVKPSYRCFVVTGRSLDKFLDPNLQGRSSVVFAKKVAKRKTILRTQPRIKYSTV